MKRQLHLGHQPGWSRKMSSKSGWLGRKKLILTFLNAAL